MPNNSRLFQIGQAGRREINVLVSEFWKIAQAAEDNGWRITSWRLTEEECKLLKKVSGQRRLLLGIPVQVKSEPWWSDDYFRGYRGHLPHPYLVLQGDVSCSICGGHSDRRIHDEPHERQAAPDPPTPEQLDEQPRAIFIDTSMAARQERINQFKQPALSSDPGGEKGNT